MNKSAPIPRFGVPALIRPNINMPITLYLHLRDGINWNGRGEPTTKAQLEKAINQCRGQHIPNDFLPALDPGDVVVLVDGVFWIDQDWNVQPCELPKSQKLRNQGTSATRGTRSHQPNIVRDIET